MATDHYVGLVLLGACFLFVGALGVVGLAVLPHPRDSTGLWGLLWIVGFGFLTGCAFIHSGWRSYHRETAAPPRPEPSGPPVL